MPWYDQDSLGSSSRAREWQLSGQRAVAPKGGVVIMRLLPHPSSWEFAMDGNAPMPLENFAELVKPPYVRAVTHWYSTIDGSRKRVVCKQLVDESCFLCSAGVQKRTVFVFNAIMVDKTNQPVRDEHNAIDVRLLFLSRRMYGDLINLMTGDFGVGDVTHPILGRPLAMKRPASDFEPWRFSPFPSPVPIFPVSPPNDYSQILDFLKHLTPPEESIKLLVAPPGAEREFDRAASLSETRSWQRSQPKSSGSAGGEDEVPF
ncbi:MAG: hypothetical protein QXS54_00510 [Candidatus Methanomethylicaceae archaeon]